MIGIWKFLLVYLISKCFTVSIKMWLQKFSAYLLRLLVLVCKVYYIFFSYILRIVEKEHEFECIFLVAFSRCCCHDMAFLCNLVLSLYYGIISSRQDHDCMIWLLDLDLAQLFSRPLFFLVFMYRLQVFLLICQLICCNTQSVVLRILKHFLSSPFDFSIK